MWKKYVPKMLMLTVGFLLIINIFASPIISPQAIQYNNSKIASVEDLPSSFSWRDINGIDFTTPIKNQAPCPSCEAYAIVAALETIVHYKVGYPFGCDLSEMHLFLCAGGTCDWGVKVKDCMEYLQEYGVPDEGCFPDPRRAWDTPCDETLPGWENRTVKIESWGWVEIDVDAMKRALIEYGPLVICTLVRSDFMSYKSGIYKNRWGGIKGGHVITIFGYDDSQRYWLIKNSWGARWGEDGWIRVSYDVHRPLRPFFSGFYGGTGILYVDGIYGNFQLDVPKVSIKNPRRGRMYFNNISWEKSLLRKFIIKRAEAIIIKGTTVDIDASDDTRNVEIYIDKELKHNITSRPFQWYLKCETYGIHELKSIAYNSNNNASQYITDIFTIPLQNK